MANNKLPGNYEGMYPNWKPTKVGENNRSNTTNRVNYDKGYYASTDYNKTKKLMSTNRTNSINSMKTAATNSLPNQNTVKTLLSTNRTNTITKMQNEAKKQIANPKNIMSSNRLNSKDNPYSYGANYDGGSYANNLSAHEKNIMSTNRLNSINNIQDQVSDSVRKGANYPSWDLGNFSQSIKPALQAEGFFDRNDMKEHELFNTRGYFDPYGRVGTTFEYVFFTKPDLCIMNLDGSLNDQFNRLAEFQFARTYYPHSLEDLQYSVGRKPFSPLLYNFRSSNLDLPDLDAGDIETAENLWGNKVVYRRSSTSSNDNFDFSMEFHDNKWLDMYMFFKLYDRYEERKAYGMINLMRTSTHQQYVMERRLHDQMAVFKFVLGEDNRELIYWAKLYGVYPKNAPRGSFGDMPEDGNFKFTVNFKANWVEDMDPNILEDFNTLSDAYGERREYKHYNVESGFGGSTSRFAKPPFIRREATKYRRSGFKWVMVWRE